MTKSPPTSALCAFAPLREAFSSRKAIEPLLTALAAITLLGLTALADDPRPFSHPDRIHYDSHCFTIDGKDVVIFSGAFHYFRCPKELWPQRFQAIKDAGFNTVESYTAWNWHEQEMPASLSDFSKVTKLDDLDEWLTMAEKYGLYVIIRPGPYICAEWSNGGFPRWMSVLEKPAGLGNGPWLRSDNPVYLAWCKHWYDAVCPIIAKHQITRKAPGQPGVILFQIENEYDFWKAPDDQKIGQLTALAADAHADGIDVPLISCWTKQVRAAKSGPLRAVFDCTNCYPRMDIEHQTGRDIRTLRAQQSDAPLATTELQGGWFAQVGERLSDQQPGLTPAEIQNLTLYAWQLGDTMTNYYMGFGGTNLDDWAGGSNITSYDYDAPIREDGSVGERYQRVQALGQMIREHGANLARADAVDIRQSASDKDVEIAERKAQDGSRYFFVRTQNQTAALTGTANVQEPDGTDLTFDYKLEPFGSMVLYLPPGVTDAKQGEWLPKPPLPLQRPANLPTPVVITKAECSVDTAPLKWERLDPGVPVESLGIYGSHYFYYKIPVRPGSAVSFQVQKNDGVIAKAGDTLLFGKPDKTKTHFTFSVPAGANELVALYENMGHANFGAGMGQAVGILGMQGVDRTQSVELAKGTADATEAQYGEQLSLPTNSHAGGGPVTIGADEVFAPSDLLRWYRAGFKLPDKAPGISAPWHLHIVANGNGFIYVNGHCLGRYWQVGPQHDFFVPDNWLNFGSSGSNVVALDLRPVDKGTSLQALSVAPDPTFAVETAEAGN